VAAQQQLVSKAHAYMIRRTGETLKQYLPAKVQQVGGVVVASRPSHKQQHSAYTLCQVL
jgi:hypothetical protein